MFEYQVSLFYIDASSGSFAQYLRDEYGISSNSDTMAIHYFFEFLKQYSNVAKDHDRNVIVVIDNYHGIVESAYLEHCMENSAADSIASFYCVDCNCENDPTTKRLLEWQFGELLDYRESDGYNNKFEWEGFRKYSLRLNESEAMELIKKFQKVNDIAFSEQQTNELLKCSTTIPQTVALMSKKISVSHKVVC